MASTNKLPRNYGKNKTQQRKLPPTDSLDAIGMDSLNIAAARADYIKKNSIQVNPPVPENVAMDSCGGQQYPANYDTVNQHLLSYYIASSSFIGYHSMALIAQHWLVMKGCSSAVVDAMKKGYELSRNDGEEMNSKKLHKIKRLDKKYKLDRNVIQAETFNNIFGVRHVLFKHKDKDFDYSLPFNPDEFKNGKYEGMSQIDPYWITPELNNDDIMDPTAIDYYEPTYWLINGKRYHKSHFVILTGEEVADYLKPTYRYGGVSMVQKLYERVYAGERTANEMPQLAMTKRMSVRKTNLEKAQANKAQFIKSLNVMNEYRDNYGVQVVGLEEDVSQLETSLADLDKVMWANYHLVTSIIGRPASKIYGTGHGGLGTGNTDDDYDISMLEALQSSHLDDVIYAHYERLMPSEFGEEMNLDISWNPLKVMSSKEIAEVNNLNSQTATNEWNMGAISEVDERDRLIADKDSGYSGMKQLEEVDPGDDDDVDLIDDLNEAQDGFTQDAKIIEKFKDGLSIGDWVDVNSDTGKIDNAPWMNQIVGRAGNGDLVFNEDGFLEAYPFDIKNKTETIEKDGKTIHIFEK